MINIEKMIEQVRKFPVLYDLSHDDYKNKRKKDKIWSGIGKELNASGEELQKKWKNLRDTYAKHIKNIETKPEPGEKRPKKWVWAALMEPFHPFMTTKPSSNVPDFDSVKNAPEELSSESDMEVIEHIQNRSDPSELVKNNFTQDTGPVTESRETNSQVLFDIQLPRSAPLTISDLAFSQVTKEPSKQNTSRKRDFDPEHSVAQIIEYFQNKKMTEYDAIDSYFLAQAKTVKTFSGKRQAITKMKIAQVIMEQELLHEEELASKSHASTQTK